MSLDKNLIDSKNTKTTAKKTARLKAGTVSNNDMTKLRQ